MNPKLSIITIVYNGEALIEGTILSVLCQSYANIEYIIIDGKSTDNTMKIVGKYSERIQKVISEPDKGLYDAMNKGLAIATGEYVWFMNCGDWIYDRDTVKQMFSDHNDESVIYGYCMMVDDDRKEIGLRSEITPHKLPKQLNWKDMARGMVVSHQSFVPKRNICPEYIEDNICADIDWVIRILKKSNSVSFQNYPISAFLVGGVSKARHKESLRDRYKVLQVHYGWLPNLLNHGYIIIRGIFHKYIFRRKKASY